MAINMGFWVCMCSIGPGKGHGMMRKKIKFFCQKNPKFIFYTMSFAHWIYWVLKIPPKPVTRQKSPFQIIVDQGEAVDPGIFWGLVKENIPEKISFITIRKIFAPGVSKS